MWKFGEYFALGLWPSSRYIQPKTFLLMAEQDQLALTISLMSLRYYRIEIRDE